jgi:protein gp37
MGETTGIAWCHHTLNPWIGCVKVSEGCANCYAEVATPTRVFRSKGEETWGPRAERHETEGWEAQARRWARAARAAGERRRVFCASLADVFENRMDLAGATAAAKLSGMRERLFELIESTPDLDWLLLTKRPENVRRLVPFRWLDRWPPHAWIGCTAENQARADERIPHLLRVPARVRFLSCEPLLEAVDVRWSLCATEGAVGGAAGLHTGSGISWVIVGGESGPKARPFDLAWARSLRDQCKAAGVAYFFKQMGSRPCGQAAPPDDGIDRGARGLFAAWRPRDRAGADPSEWPADLRVQEFPGA